MARTERLSAKQRTILDALLRTSGIKAAPTAHAVDQAADAQAPPRWHGTDAEHDQESAEREACASGADREENEPRPSPPHLFKLWRRALQQSAGNIDLGLSEWIDSNGLSTLWKMPEVGLSDPQAAPRAGSAPSPLVVMRGTGTKIPFFCVHALLGSVFHYHRLASLLDKEQPFYALQAPGLDGAETPLDTVEDFAALYLRSVRETQPTGPYKIGGYSFGSWIAVQMASQLIADGEDVSLVAILGTGVPTSVSMPMAYEHISFLSQYMEDYEKNILEPFLPYKERMKRASGHDKYAAMPPLLRVVMAHNRAALRFDPRPYAGKLTLFETVDQQLRTPLDTSRGWKRLSTQPVETHLVAGNHLSMLDEPHVRDLAEKLSLCLDRS